MDYTELVLPAVLGNEGAVIQNQRLPTVIPIQPQLQYRYHRHPGDAQTQAIITLRADPVDLEAVVALRLAADLDLPSGNAVAERIADYLRAGSGHDTVVATRDWLGHLAEDESIRSRTSVCLTVEGADTDFIKAFAGLLEKEGAAYDIAGYRDAPAGLRIWCGATVDTADVEALGPWLDWAWASLKAV